MTYILLMAKGRDRARFAACVRERGPVTFFSDWGRPAGLADRATHLVIGMAPGGRGGGRRPLVAELLGIQGGLSQGGAGARGRRWEPAG